MINKFIAACKLTEDFLMQNIESILTNHNIRSFAMENPFSLKNTSFNQIKYKKENFKYKAQKFINPSIKIFLNEDEECEYRYNYDDTYAKVFSLEEEMHFLKLPSCPKYLYKENIVKSGRKKRTNANEINFVNNFVHITHFYSIYKPRKNYEFKRFYGSKSTKKFHEYKNAVKLKMIYINNSAKEKY
ncbi:hypothetical protein COBT_000717 [Conglomerata obtusa]